MTTVDRNSAYLGGMFSLSEQVAVVTGAAHGIGRAIALGMSRAGANVGLVDLAREGLEETVGLIEQDGGRAVAFVRDISSEDEVEQLFSAVDESLGPVDVLVNNAAVNLVMGPPDSYPLDGWESTMRINLTGTFLCARAASQRMIRSGRGGSIVNISSINGSTANGRGSLSYDVSKAGVNHLTRCLATELAQHSIRVNALQPCQFNPGWDERLNDPAFESVARNGLRGIPLGRFGEPEELVGPVIFLASTAASMVTGVCLPVDGGNLALNAGAGGQWPSQKF